MIGGFDPEIDAVAHVIDRRQAGSACRILCQIYGIDRCLGMVIVAEIERFPTARHLCAWAGLTPTVRSSEAKARPGHISSLGSKALRRALVEAAPKAVEGGGPLREELERIAKRRDRKIAEVAAAGKMLTPCSRRRDPLREAAGPPGAPRVRDLRHDGRRGLGCRPGPQFAYAS